MPFHAQAACKAESVPLLAIRRKPWTPGPGDRWTSVLDMEAAVAALGQEPRRVFLTVGRLELPHFAEFAAAPLSRPRHRADRRPAAPA